MATVTKPLALNESLNSTENTPRNIADVLADELDGIKQAISSQSGSGDGHIIQNSSGANMPQENTMQFTDAHLTDDSVGGKTVIENFKAVTEAEYSSETEDGAYIITDGDGATIGEASDDYVEVVADGEKTRAQLLTDLEALVDWTKINENSYIVFGNDIYRVNVPNVKIFMTSAISVGHLYNTMFDLKNHLSQQYDTTSNGSTLTDNSSAVPTNGRTITLYYGNRKAVVDLQTTANRCLYDSNTTVKQKIDNLSTMTTTQVSFTHSSLNSAYKANLAKKDNLVVFNFVINASADIPVLSILISTEGAIPSAFRPVQETYVNVGDGISLVFRTDGSVLVQNISAPISTGYHTFSGVYFTNIVFG